MDTKETKAETNTITFDRQEIEKPVSSIYEAISIIGKRAEQINTEMKTELNRKLDEFAFNTDSLDEIFENREQIEVSKHYERLPKSTLVAIREWLDDDTYFRKTTQEEE